MVADPVILAVLDDADPVRVGPYELLGVLGGGEMGRVFLGRSPGGRLVAVSVIHRHLAADRGFRLRFAREVAVARRVSGIFTAPVVDADFDAPQPWLATGYVAGPSLDKAVMVCGPMPVASVMALAAGLAEGLAAVHAAGLVHRNLKPANVLLADDGPRIIDFGISQALTAADLTDPGTVFATPSFMSPEQGMGVVVGPPSDIFSLGSVLVYAATGRTPFKMGQAFEIFYQVVNGQPDVSGVPGQIRPLIMRCLDKDPELRPSTDQILADLGPQRIEAGWLPASFEEMLRQYGLTSFRGGGLSSSAAINQPIRAEIARKARSTAGHAFLSYVREDSPQVDKLQRVLERAGVPVWRDTADLWPGEDWRAKIRHAITNNALAFIACFSQASISRYKSYQNEELMLAIDQMRMRPANDPWLIPVRFNECEIPDREIGAGRTLASIQRADLFGDSAEEASERLVAAILRILGRNSGFLR